MQDSTEEIARRILDTVLRQLEGGAGRRLAAHADTQPAGTGGGSNPLIVIMLGDSPTARAGSDAANKPGDASPIEVKQTGCGCQNNSPAGQGNSLQSTHPGLERFDLPEEKTLSSAPRRCFMEPDRACVESGACEMRGF
jgi:hypothetical protein